MDKFNNNEIFVLDKIVIVVVLTFYVRGLKVCGVLPSTEASVPYSRTVKR